MADRITPSILSLAANILNQAVLIKCYANQSGEIDNPKEIYKLITDRWLGNRSQNSISEATTQDAILLFESVLRWTVQYLNIIPAEYHCKYFIPKPMNEELFKEISDSLSGMMMNGIDHSDMNEEEDDDE